MLLFQNHERKIQLIYLLLNSNCCNTIKKLLNFVSPDWKNCSWKLSKYFSAIILTLLVLFSDTHNLLAAEKYEDNCLYIYTLLFFLLFWTLYICCFCSKIIIYMFLLIVLDYFLRNNYTPTYNLFKINPRWSLWISLYLDILAIDSLKIKPLYILDFWYRGPQLNLWESVSFLQYDCSGNYILIHAQQWKDISCKN